MTVAPFDALAPSELANAIALRDKASVARTPGVGPKVAERIVTELKDKAPAFANVDLELIFVMRQLVHPPWAARRLRRRGLAWMNESGGRVQSPAATKRHNTMPLN